jgi:RNA polymerase sigma-70 factor, ECF subfamily
VNIDSRFREKPERRGGVLEQLTELISSSYLEGVKVHGDVGVTFERFRERLERIVLRHADSVGPEVRGSFIGSLHMTDLLLACACGDGSEIGWQRFFILYRKYLSDIGRALIGGCAETEEIGETIWIDLFLPDKSGASRIASYDGRSSLATWLRVVVTNRIINERQRKDYRAANLEGIAEPADPSALQCLEDKLGRDRYQAMILDTFKRSFSTLSARERLILLLRYDQDVPLGDIAQLLGVHQSTITRQIDRAVERLRQDVVSQLSEHYSLGAPAIEECMDVARKTFSNAVSILGLIEEATCVEPAKRLYSKMRAQSGG